MSAREKSRKIKTKLAVQEVRKKKMHAACKNTFARKNTNVVDDASDMQNNSSADEPACSFREKTTLQASFKCKKKHSNNEETVDKASSDIQYMTNDSIEWNNLQQKADKKIDNSWKLDNSEEDTQEDDNWIQIVPKEKRNLGLPLVVDMLSDDISSINLPQIFEHDQRTRLEKTNYDNVFEDINALFNKNVCMRSLLNTHVESTNSKYNSHIPIKHLKQTSLVLNIAKNDESKEASDNRSKDSNVNNISSPIRSPMKTFIKNENSKLIDHSNDTEAHGSHKNISSHQRMCNHESPKIYCIRNIVIVIMERKSRLCFTGKLLVKVLYGAVKIYGSILNRSASAIEAYSPRGYSNIVIETSEDFLEGSINDIWMTLAAEGITRDSKSKLQIDIDNIRLGAAVLVLQNFENNLTLFLKTYFPYFKLFPNVKNPYYFSWTDPRRAEIILQANLRLEQYDDFNYRRLIIDHSITTDVTERMLNRWRANEWSCTLVAGGKNVGKSTSVRCLINSLLLTSGKVVLVDVDPGQAECTPPGCISYSLIEEPLIGPNFTHLRAPVYQLFIDDVNVSRCVTRYLEGIKMLIERLKECPVLSRLPIVVNTMGFTQSLGWDIAIFTIKLIRPSIILQIMSSKKKNNYDDVLSAEVVNKQECSWTFCDESFINWNRPCEHDLCIIYSQAETIAARTNEWNMEPYQQRELVMMSYLSDIVREKNDSLQYNTGPSLSIYEAVPYTAPFSSLCIIPQRLFGIPASRALSVINGNIVALCGIDLTDESSQESEGISNLRVLTQRSPLCTCYGFGIIRGVDMERQEIFINTPLSISMLQYVNCLAGCIPVPPALLQLHQGAPYIGGNAALPTSREPRRGYFRMRYQNKSSKS